MWCMNKTRKYSYPNNYVSVRKLSQCVMSMGHFCILSIALKLACNGG